MDTVLRGWMIRMSLQDPVFWPTCQLAWDMHADANNAPVAAAMPFVGGPLDHPLSLNHISLEVEERGVERRQELWLEVSCDGGRTYREMLRQEYNFSPPGTTFEREDWALRAEGVTRLRVRIKPDMAGKPCRA